MKPGREVVARNVPTEMGRISATLAFRKGGADLTFQGDFHTPPRYLVFRVPYGVRLKSFESDAVKSSAEGGLIRLSPDARSASVEWEEIPNAHAGTYQDILKGYRSEFGFIVEDGNYDPSRADKPFLLDDEKNHPPAPLSFDLVRKAFLKEYRRRYEEHIRKGGSPYPVEPPPLLKSVEERRMAYEK